MIKTTFRKARMILGCMSALILITLPSSAQQVIHAPQQERKYTFVITDKEVQDLAYIIDQSTAPHNMVKNIISVMQQQLLSQTISTPPPAPADSIAKTQSSLPSVDSVKKEEKTKQKK